MAFDDLITSGVRTKLKALKWALRVHLLGRALAWVVVALVAGVFLTLGVDYALHMDRAQRGLIVALALVGVGYVTWRFLLRPFRVPMDAEELALVLEQHYGDLDDRLISTLQFASHRGSREGTSDVLIRKVAAQASELVENLDVRGPVESKRTWRRMSLPAAAVAILAVFAIFNLEVMGLWFERNVLFADTPWPQETYLAVEGGPDFRVVRGESLRVAVEADADHVVPREVTFHMRFPALGVVAENIAAASAGGNTYVKTFDNVAESFKFYVTGNDDRTDWCKVEVVDPPELLDVRFKVTYPAYMNRPLAAPPVTRGVLVVPPGSRLALAGRANKDLTRARLLLDGKEVATLRVEWLGDSDDSSGQDRPRGVEGNFSLSERPQKASMSLQFELTDTEGITNRRGAAYAIRLEPDRPPSVNMNRIAVRANVTARALIPLVIQGRDDHGLAAIEVSVAPEAPEAATTKPAGRKIPVPGVPAGLREIDVRYELDLEPMNLKEGYLLRVQVIAYDTLPASFAREMKPDSPGGPNVSRSLVQTFKIVSEEELLAELVRRQKEIRQEFTACVVLQAEVRDKVRGVSDRLTSSGIDAAVRSDLAGAGRNQQRIAAQCATVAQRLIGVLDEMNYNRVGSPVEKRRLAEKVIAPLNEICKKPMIDLGAVLARASKETDAAVMRQSAADSAEILDEFCKRLEAILGEMKRLESRQELENRLKMIIDVGTKILEQIRQKAQQETGTIFDTTTQPEKEK